MHLHIITTTITQRRTSPWAIVMIRFIRRRRRCTQLSPSPRTLNPPPSKRRSPSPTNIHPALLQFAFIRQRRNLSRDAWMSCKIIIVPVQRKRKEKIVSKIFCLKASDKSERTLQSCSKVVLATHPCPPPPLPNLLVLLLHHHQIPAPMTTSSTGTISATRAILPLTEGRARFSRWCCRCCCVVILAPTAAC